ncbi:MAG: cell division protein FtsL [Paracoccaceae bacterium]|tara:strand:- start:15 stop:323 length:309 start_codon:yes stop_codon:yes gene_type:complete
MRIVLLASFFILCVISAIWAYQMNYETRAKKKQILDITKKINFTLNRIELLKAEWAFLNSPERLSKLVDENFLNLNLIPISKKNIVHDIKSLETFNEIENDQ